MNAGDLMTQTEAREKARELNNQGIACIAGVYPPTAWGGEEQGWTIYYLPVESDAQ